MMARLFRLVTGGVAEILAARADVIHLRARVAELEARLSGTEADRLRDGIEDLVAAWPRGPEVAALVQLLGRVRRGEPSPPDHVLSVEERVTLDDWERTLARQVAGDPRDGGFTRAVLEAVRKLRRRAEGVPRG